MRHFCNVEIRQFNPGTRLQFPDAVMAEMVMHLPRKKDYDGSNPSDSSKNAPVAKLTKARPW